MEWNGMSCVEDTFPQGLHLLNQIIDRGIPTIVGGVFATFAPHLVIKNHSVDMVCVGEGETCIVKLCERISNGKDYSDVPNLWIKDQYGKIRKTRINTQIDNLQNKTRKRERRR